MGIFGDVDAATIKDIPEGLVPDTYSCTVTDAESKKSNAGTTTGLSIKYTVNYGDFETWSIQTWDRIPTPDDGQQKDNKTGEMYYLKDRPEQLEKSWGYLKKRLRSILGDVTDAELNRLDPRDLIGRKVLVTVANQKDSTYSKVTKIEPGNFDGGGGLEEFAPVQPVNNPFAEKTDE